MINLMKETAGVAPEINLRIHPDFEAQGRYHPKSQTWVSVAKQKGPMSSKYFFLKSWHLMALLPNLCICENVEQNGFDL